MFHKISSEPLKAIYYNFSDKISENECPDKAERRLFNSAKPEFTQSRLKQINSIFPSYIFYKKHANHIDFFATCCNTKFTADTSHPEMFGGFDGSVSHNGDFECPFCGKRGTLKSFGMGAKNLTEYKKIVFFEKSRNGSTVYIRCCEISKCYAGDPWCSWLNRNYSSEKLLNPPIEIIEERRFTLSKGSSILAENPCRPWFRYPRGDEQWNRFKRDCVKPFQGDIYGRTQYYWIFNADDVLDKSFLKYSGISEYINSAEGISDDNAIAYLCLYAKYPIIEIAAKQGLSKYITHFIYGSPNKKIFNWAAKSPKDFLRGNLDINDFQYIKKHDPSPKAIRLYMSKKKAGKSGNDVFKTAENEVEVLSNFATPGFFNYMALTFCNPNAKADICKYIIKYSKKSRKTICHISRAWHDYIRMAEEAGFDLFNHNVAFPKNLEEAHENAVEIINAIRARKNEEKRKEIEEKAKKRTEKLEEIYGAFECGDLKIVVPHTHDDIIREGKELSICVGSYAERHFKGATTILFIRKISALGTPYFTIEIDEMGKKIRQCHGYKNEYMYDTTHEIIEKPDEIKLFEAEFAKYIKNPAKYIKEKAKMKKAG
jgi:hypothetical protein